MTESAEKTRIKPIDDKADYALWRICVKAAMTSKGMKEVLNERSHSFDEVFTEKMETASNIIISVLGDHALRVVLSDVGDPRKMMDRLDARYDSKSTAKKISKICELVSLRYC